ncbi:uncharacterized protein BBA_00025 [Beauveria bassiana ARSEF 2860]|uniref:Secondary alcohol dehydrogenase n=1 Tax=Beauveria bassiana (strain ARSEF 2860) TaxID=655819 RepID=J4WKX7_BEAB2|nr:uncharacterized protein BBA_00025 [Beauveria bassiana ARSEF 2860]EJP70395.1 hypothetical protein BBA_00025 [Beauveria bassiana ARSEF 2860]
MSSADTTPISAERFAAALPSLSLPLLALKVLEIRNSIAHLQYSNDQLRPFAADDNDGGADAVCVDAIRENEAVIERMAERIALIRVEVEDVRGVSWQDFEDKAQIETLAREEGRLASGQQQQQEQEAQGRRQQQQQQQEAEGEVTGIAAQVNGVESSPWTDGTFQTGTIRNGEVHMDPVPGARAANGGGAGGSLSDEQLRAAMEERMRQMTTDEDEDGGLHL